MIELNKTINWKPASTGERLWKLARKLGGLEPFPFSFLGYPIAYLGYRRLQRANLHWSVEQLKNEIDKALSAGLMSVNPLADFIPGDMNTENYNTFDLHRPYVDNIVLDF